MSAEELDQQLLQRAGPLCWPACRYISEPCSCKELQPMISESAIPLQVACKPARAMSARDLEQQRLRLAGTLVSATCRTACKWF